MQSLNLKDYQRYGRQMILEGFGLQGQLKLKQSSVVVVGAGGLGCPALQYLAAAGVGLSLPTVHLGQKNLVTLHKGRIGIIDHDVVELSNLQRQILHTEKNIGVHKAVSAAQAIKQINHSVKVDVMPEAIFASNAIALLESFDIILDCTDNSPTRYLLSDSAVFLKKPLVSGAAQRFDGQLCTYGLGETGPCYRCLFPKPPAQEILSSCEETGILGAVTGIIGNLQALEVIKLITGLHDGKSTLLLYSALAVPPFRTVKLRSRRANCSACGNVGGKIDKIQDIDYVTFCGGPRPDWVSRGLQDEGHNTRIHAKDLRAIIDSQAPIKIIDVRSRTEFGICQLPSSTNVPLSVVLANPAACFPEDHNTPLYVVCRLGNDSQIAAEILRESLDGVEVFDLVGGLKAWAKYVNRDFPVY